MSESAAQPPVQMSGSASSQESKAPKLAMAGIVVGDLLPQAPLLASGQMTNVSKAKLSVLSLTARQGTTLMQIQANLQGHGSPHACTNAQNTQTPASRPVDSRPDRLSDQQL
ncbi:MAG: hypothetical protein ACAF41_33285 (plasmid) [Leptolyngbya sp. BL-A-14]